MNKVEMIKVLAERVSFRQEDVESLLDAFADLIVECASKKEPIGLHSVFHVKTKPWKRDKYNNCVQGNVPVIRKRNFLVYLEKGSRLDALGKDVAQ